MASQDDHQLAARLASEAGTLLVELRARLYEQGAEPGVLKDEGDQASHRFLMEQLAIHRPDDAVLSEEGRDSTARLAAARVWIVDPLDGTREFSEVPRTDWAVHVALVENGIPTAGAVALPALGTVFSTADPVVLPAAADPLRVVVSRSRPPKAALVIAEAVEADLVEMGSAGAKATAILRGEVDIYPHSGGQYEWDSCAPVAVCAAAGLHCSRLDGSPLVYNRENPYLPDLLICRPEHAAAVIEAARDTGA